MSLELELSSAELPENLQCVIPNATWQELAALLRVLLPDGFKINRGNTTPAPEDRIWPWKRTNPDGTPDDWYEYAGGYWLSDNHPDFTGKVVEWEGAEANIEALDGNTDVAGTAVTATAGPFWEKVDEMNGRIPVGSGELDAGPPAVNISENEDKGAYNATLDDSHYRHHRHWVAARQTVSSGSDPTSSNQVADQGDILPSGTDYDLVGTGTAATVGLSSYVTGQNQAGENVAFPILPKVRGIWFIRKTSRRYKRLNA